MIRLLQALFPQAVEKEIVPREKTRLQSHDLSPRIERLQVAIGEIPKALLAEERLLVVRALMPLLGKVFVTTFRRELAPGGPHVCMPTSKTRVHLRPGLATRARNLVSSSSLAPAGLAMVANIFMSMTTVPAVPLLKGRLQKEKEKARPSPRQQLLRS
jgi:anti-sigma factor RsiW